MSSVKLIIVTFIYSTTFFLIQHIPNQCFGRNPVLGNITFSVNREGTGKIPKEINVKPDKKYINSI